MAKKRTDKVTYEVSGGPVKQSDAQIVGDALAGLRKKHGSLTPEHVVEEAKNKASPLHRYFEWDIASAARLHWLDRASQILRCVHVVPAPARDPIKVRAFVVNGEGKHEYIERKEMLSSQGPRGFHVTRALDELVSWVRRNADFDELSVERAAIQKLIDNRRSLDAAAE